MTVVGLWLLWPVPTGVMPVSADHTVHLTRIWMYAQSLARGERMVATLNQPQYQPWPLEEQVVAIYAGIHGWLDKVPVPQVPRFQEELRETLRTEGSIYDAIRESGALSDETAASLMFAMARYVTAGEIPGAVALAFQDAPPAPACAVGLADRERDESMHVDTLFGVMSMTKPITATALMMLVDEGKLSIGDAVEKYLPAFSDSKTTSGEPVRGLKIRHLLTHTSGLTGDQGCEDSLAATAELLPTHPSIGARTTRRSSASSASRSASSAWSRASCDALSCSSLTACERTSVWSRASVASASESVSRARSSSISSLSASSRTSGAPART